MSSRFDWGTPFSGLTADSAQGSALLGGSKLRFTNIYVTGGSGMMVPWQVGDRVQVILRQASGSCSEPLGKAKVVAKLTLRTTEGRNIPEVEFTIPARLRPSEGRAAAWSVELKVRPYNLRDKEYAPERIVIGPTVNLDVSRTCSG